MTIIIILTLLALIVSNVFIFLILSVIKKRLSRIDGDINSLHHNQLVLDSEIRKLFLEHKKYERKNKTEKKGIFREIRNKQRIEVDESVL